MSKVLMSGGMITLTWVSKAFPAMSSWAMVSPVLNAVAYMSDNIRPIPYAPSWGATSCTRSKAMMLWPLSLLSRSNNEIGRLLASPPSTSWCVIRTSPIADKLDAEPGGVGQAANQGGSFDASSSEDSVCLLGMRGRHGWHSTVQQRGACTQIRAPARMAARPGGRILGSTVAGGPKGPI